MANMTRSFAAASALIALALTGCGGDGKGGGGGASGGGGGDSGGGSAAADLCLRYRNAVAAVRFEGSDAQQAADFAAAAKAARSARSTTKAGELGRYGADYLESLATVAGAYDGAAAAKAEHDDDAFNRALDVGESTDDRIDGLARRGGLKRCALGAVGPGEGGVSQSGFPAMAVPRAAFGKSPPSANNRAAPYPLSPDEVLLLERGPKLPTGSVPVDEAARRFTAIAGSLAPREVGPSGNQLVPMREYAYKRARDAGTVHVFSGQGNLFLLFCESGRVGGPSPELRRACDRAVATLGFVMF